MGSTHLPPQISKTENVILGKSVKFFGFPTRGPGQGILVLDALVVVVKGTITVGTALWDGRDVCKLIQRVQIQQRSGKVTRWNLQGDEGRIAAIKYGGIRKWHEHTNVAVGAGQAINLYYRIPMSKRFARRGKDFALPAHELEFVNITWNTLATAATATTVLSADSLQAYILAEWHEEDNVEIKSVDIVTSQQLTSATQGYLQAQGVVHDLDIFKSGTTGGGGESLAAITNITVPEMGIEPMTPLDLTDHYRIKRELQPVGFAATPGTEQVLEPTLESTQKALPVVTATEKTAVWDGAVVDKYRVNITGGTAGCVAITREIVPKPEASIVRAVDLFKIPPGAQPYMKTEGKTRRGLNQGWTEYQMLVGCMSFGRLPDKARKAA